MSQPEHRLHCPPQNQLPQGLRVRILPALTGAQGAALVRVYAGSHDAPAAYPGLAHFLEHLLFLGSARYGAADGLMAFVQGVGGQLNATTRERHTDFFFQVPARHLEQALLRLLDMLVKPTLDIDAQRRERDVLHAEFLARSQDRETLCDAALATAIDPAHPAAGFHAGHRDTLPVDEPAFQQALRGYLDRFYRTGQIELLLAGPQDRVELQRLADIAEARLIPGPAVSRVAPALTLSEDRWLTLHLSKDQPRLLLGFVVDGVSPSTSAQDYLASWVASEAPNGLLARLRDANLCQALSLRVPYRFDGQGLLVIEALLTDAGLRQRAVVAGAVVDWLRFFITRGCWPTCSGEYQAATHRYLLGAEPLQLLRHWVESGAWSRDATLALQPVVQLVQCMLASDPVILTVADDEFDRGEPVETQGFPLRMACEAPVPLAMRDWDWDWQVPQPNPWLLPIQPLVAGDQPTDTLPLRTFGPVNEAGQGALMLRWCFTTSPIAAHWHAVDQALRSRAWAARQAGVTLGFDNLGRSWTLSLRGFAEAVPAILDDLSPLLGLATERGVADAMQHAQRAATLGQDAMLLRQLLDRLPEAVGQAVGQDVQSATADETRLDTPWRNATWDGLAVGFSDVCVATLQPIIRRLPGEPASGAVPPAASFWANRWLHVPGPAESVEVAYVLFRPLPGFDAPSEAAWRILGRLLEGAFFRRLRSELQLGYAVLCRFGQFAGQAGVFFAVQSPTASATEIHHQVERFIEAFSLRLREWPSDDLVAIASEMAEQQGEALAELRCRSERAWQAMLAGQPPNHVEAVSAAMARLSPHDLVHALQLLREAGRLVLSTAPQPTDWR